MRTKLETNVNFWAEQASKTFQSVGSLCSADITGPAAAIFRTGLSLGGKCRTAVHRYQRSEISQFMWPGRK